MRETALVYYTVLSKFVQYAALATFFLSAGIAVDGQTGTLASFARAFCFIWSLLIFAALLFWVRHEGHAQARNHELQMALLEADIATIAPAQTVEQKTLEPPAEHIDFAPPEFVKFIWDYREGEGVFPTIEQCVGANKGFGHGMAQLHYQKMVSAGAIINRIPKQYAGDPAPDWSRARFERAAEDAMTLPDET